MEQPSSLKIDAYSHIVPPKYKEVLDKIAPEQVESKIAYFRSLYDLDNRFEIMDKHEPLRQVLTLAWPPVEEIADSVKAPELAKLANDEMADLVIRYPDRFVAAIASLPMNNIDAALNEVDRAIKDLGFRGVYVHTPVNDKPLDLPEFMPLYEKMSQYDLPIFIHPMRLFNYSDYRTEDISKYGIASTFGWPYETTVAMARLVFSGIMEKYPNLKIVTHHCGGMVPYFAERIAQFSHFGQRSLAKEGQPSSTKAVIDYYRMFYGDTALYGNTTALMCAYDFFSADHLLFGADFPLGDIEAGKGSYGRTINAIEQMDITEVEKKKIYEDNARSLLRLPQ
ncbi:amidohydrolase family protein [Chloroflexota bacterium]